MHRFYSPGASGIGLAVGQIGVGTRHSGRPRICGQSNPVKRKPTALSTKGSRTMVSLSPGAFFTPPPVAYHR